MKVLFFLKTGMSERPAGEVERSCTRAIAAPRKSNFSKQAQAAQTQQVQARPRLYPSTSLSHRVLCTVVLCCCRPAASHRELKATVGAQAPRRNPASAHMPQATPHSRICQLFPNTTKTSGHGFLICGARFKGVDEVA